MRFRISELRQLISEALRKAYEILGVSPDASAEQIKKAYREKAIALHPDRNAGKDTGADMVKLNVAYGLLSDPDKRRRYDLMGDKTLGDAGGGFGYGGPPPPRRPDPYSPPPRPRPQPPPPRPQSPPPPRSTKRYFTYYGSSPGGRGSRKFWWVEPNFDGNYSVRVGFGRIGSPGQTQVQGFGSSSEMWKWLSRMINSKLDKGYRETNAPPGGGPAPRNAAPPPPPPKAKAEPAPGPEKPKEPSAPRDPNTYKVYGRKGSAPVHTRYKSKVYVGPPDSKFKSGQRATVALGSDGRLSIHDPATGHTQHWTAESFAALIDELLVEDLLSVGRKE